MKVYDPRILATFAKSPSPPSAKRLNPWTKPSNVASTNVASTTLDLARLIDSPAASEAVKKQRLREAIVKDEPTVKITKGKDKRYRVYVGLNDGTGRKFYSTCKTEKDARDKVVDFLAGIGPEPRELSAPPESVRASPRDHITPGIMPRRKYRKTHHVAGPGRGIHTATTRASAIVQGEQLALSKALVDGLISEDFMHTEDIYFKALSIIDNQSKHGELEVQSALQRAVAAGRRKLTAEGAQSERQLRRHKTVCKMAIENQAGPDIEKQIALAESVVQDLRGISDSKSSASRINELKGLDLKSKNDVLATQFVMQSIRHSIAVMKDKVDGHRPTTKDRQTLQTMVSAATNQVPDGLRAATSRLLDIRLHSLSSFRDLWANFEIGDAHTPCIQKEKSGRATYPVAYRDFVLSQWYELTRRSERMKDEVRNPRDKSDKKNYRVHFREDSYGTMLKLMQAAGRNKFGDEFHLSERKMKQIMPHEVRRAGEETCVCIHHLKWEKMIQSYGKHRRLLGVQCDCNNITKLGDEARKMLTCEKAENQRFLKPTCLDGSCTSCPGFAAVKKCELENEAGTGVQFMRDKWAKGQQLMADGSAKDVYDFYSLPSDFDDLEKEMDAYCRTLIEHHDLAMMQDYDWAMTQENFPRGHFCSVQDFSLAYTHTRRVKQQSLWFQEIRSSLYGACVRIHLEDISNEYIAPAERRKLKEEFVKQGVTPILTFTLIGISADHGQDNAFVQNFNDRITVWVKSIAAAGTIFKVHHARSDGCRGQYKCAQHFYYISRQQAETLIRLDWCFSCSCHGKDLVDPENG